MDVQGTHGGHDNKVGQNKSPTTGPCTPEPSPQIRNVDPDLDSERPRQRLAHGDSVAELIFRQPLSFCDQFFFHLPAECNRAAETKRSKAEVISHQVHDPHSENAFVLLHTPPPSSQLLWVVTFDL